MSSTVYIILVITVVIACGYNATANHLFEPDIPEECEKQGYCMDPSIPYPYEYVRDLLPKIQDIVKNFKVIDLTKPKMTPEQVIPVCDNRVEVFYPKVARDENLKWWFVISHGSVEQGWRVEMCMNPGKKCTKLDSSEQSFSGTCSQKTIYQPVQALDKDGKAVSKTVLLPLTCYCKVPTDC